MSPRFSASPRLTSKSFAGKSAPLRSLKPCSPARLRRLPEMRVRDAGADLWKRRAAARETARRRARHRRRRRRGQAVRDHCAAVRRTSRRLHAYPAARVPPRRQCRRCAARAGRQRVRSESRAEADEGQRGTEAEDRRRRAPARSGRSAARQKRRKRTRRGEQGRAKVARQRAAAPNARRLRRLDSSEFLFPRSQFQFRPPRTPIGNRNRALFLLVL